MTQPPKPTAVRPQATTTTALRLVELVHPVKFGSMSATRSLSLKDGRLEFDSKNKLILAFPRAGKARRIVIPMANVVCWEDAPLCGACGVVPVAAEGASCPDCREIDEQTAPAPAPAPAVKSDTVKYVRDEKTGLIREVGAEDA